MSRHGRFLAVVELPSRTRRAARPVFALIGNGSFNYYHWLVEILPRAQAARERTSFRESDFFVDAPSIEWLSSQLEAFALATTAPVGRRLLSTTAEN